MDECNVATTTYCFSEKAISQVPQKRSSTKETVNLFDQTKLIGLYNNTNFGGQQEIHLQKLETIMKETNFLTPLIIKVYSFKFQGKLYQECFIRLLSVR